MILSARYTDAVTAVAITLQDGAIWHTDAALPPDTDIRRALHEWLADGGVIEPYVPPAPPAPPTPSDVSFWQFMMAAWQAGFISQAEALAAVKWRDMPAAFVGALDQAVLAGAMTAQQRAAAELKFAGITRMVRSDPLFTIIVQAGIATEAQLDAVFVLAASIT